MPRYDLTRSADFVHQQSLTVLVLGVVFKKNQITIKIMKKTAILSLLLGSILTLGASISPVAVHAQTFTIQDLVQLLIAIGAIAPEKANMARQAVGLPVSTTTEPTSPAVSGVSSNVTPSDSPSTTTVVQNQIKLAAFGDIVIRNNANSHFRDEAFLPLNMNDAKSAFIQVHSDKLNSEGNPATNWNEYVDNRDDGYTVAEKQVQDDNSQKWSYPGGHFTWTVTSYSDPLQVDYQRNHPTRMIGSTSGEFTIE